MTSGEARVFMARGGKVRYKTWWWGNHLWMDKATIYDQNGKPFPKDEFDNEKSNDWEEYSEIRHGTQNEQKTNSDNRNESDSGV